MQQLEMTCCVPLTRCLSGRLTSPLHATHMTPLLPLAPWACPTTQTSQPSFVPLALATRCLWLPPLLFLGNSKVSCTLYCNSFPRQHYPHWCNLHQCNHLRCCHNQPLLALYLLLDHSSLAWLLLSWLLCSWPISKLQRSCSSSCLSSPSTSFLCSFYLSSQPTPC